MPGRPYRYLELAENLRAQIRSGRLALGEQLPSMADLRSQGYSDGTIKQAIRMLEDEELIRSEHGKGRFVADQLPEERLSESERVQAQIADLQDQIRRLGERLAEHEREGH